ncbi:MAG TPA: FAD-binding oxidoreductase [Solirubrobacteraceae bacterium]|nr:FAD-binding oxidoreductase [Solirubrobacteraceae bacterium]
MRVTVIGAGIVGVHVAVALVRRGADVTLIDRGEPGAGTTAGSFAWIDASAPGISPYLELRVLGVQGWRRQAQELGRPGWLSLSGTLAWAHAGDDADTLEQHARRLESMGVGPERLTVEQALRCEPDLRLPPDLECVYRHDGEGWVDTGPAIAALVRRGAAAGLRLRTATEVRELSVGASGRIAGLTLASGESVQADAVVCCLGRFTESLLSCAGAHVPMREPGRGEVPVAGLVARTTPIRSRLDRVLLADGVLIRPDGAGGLVVGSDAYDAELGAEPKPESGARLMALLASRVRGAEEAHAAQTWMCVRAIPADLLPVVGWALDGLYVVATHSGVTLAPALAELVASELFEDRDRDELARFRPGRFRSVDTVGL